MKKQIYTLLLAAATFAAAGCSDKAAQEQAQPPHAEKAPEPQAKKVFTGTVAETMDAAGYTYILLDTGTEKIWFATLGCAVKVGDKLNIPSSGMERQNFVSKTLNRTFDKIYFVESIAAQGEGGATCTIPMSQTLHGSSRAAAPKTSPADVAGIKKAAGGKTVAEIYAQKKALAGKTVKIRGKVAKYNEGIMGKNWVHMQDGTGADGTNDLTATTMDSAAVGDTVVLQGMVVLDKDFGYGYKYDVLIDNATITKE